MSPTLLEKVLEEQSLAGEFSQWYLEWSGLPHGINVPLSLTQHNSVTADLIYFNAVQVSAILCY